MSSVVRNQGSCVAIRSLSPSSSINRCSHASASSARVIQIPTTSDQVTRIWGTVVSEWSGNLSTLHIKTAHPRVQILRYPVCLGARARENRLPCERVRLRRYPLDQSSDGGPHHFHTSATEN
ncbi:hypothetical protein Goshw_003444 [Gossypium schwendimanii]|uniref:Uncharacterized protein n=1 Tax=Gossypium schwendimanii TaxID=34291 RepID=A0A7J9L7K6_GOSSC|nr:hypothetical protein [Gossypium schwendimanii]